MGVALATSSALAADAAAEVADLGGNAVDCALAAALLTTNTEPGVCALAGSAYVTVWASDSEPVTIDGNVAVPGKGHSGKLREDSVASVTMEYGGGITTIVGPGSVAVPGTLAAFEKAWSRFGKANWRDIFAPSVRAAKTGFPLPKACHYYLNYSGESIFGRSIDGFNALHDAHGRLLDTGSAIVLPGLADSLSAIASEGADLFYRGELARQIVDHVQAGGGNLSMQDMETYAAIERRSLQCRLGNWQLATNPPPAVGGAVLVAMLEAFGRSELESFDQADIARLVDVQAATLDYRKRRLDLADDRSIEAKDLLDLAESGQLLSRWTSASTVHTSAVDQSGLACAVTASSGYGSGEIPPGTGLWLNNCLGEIELNRQGLDAGPPGARLPSNMSPTVGRSPNSVLSAGSPGADRITTALHQFLVHALQRGLPLQQAVSHPRLHVDTSGDHYRLMAESDLGVTNNTLPLHEYEGLNMYFGGVGAALYDQHAGFSAAADPRREGGVFISGA